MGFAVSTCDLLKHVYIFLPLNHGHPLLQRIAVSEKHEYPAACFFFVTFQVSYPFLLTVIKCYPERLL